MKVLIVLTVLTYFLTLSSATFNLLKSSRTRNRALIQPISSYRTASFLKSEVSEPIPVLPVFYSPLVSALAPQESTLTFPIPSAQLPPLPAVRVPIRQPQVHVTSYSTPTPVITSPVIPLHSVVPTYREYHPSYVEPFRGETIPLYEKPLYEEHYSGYGHSYTKHYF